MAFDVAEVAFLEPLFMGPGSLVRFTAEFERAAGVCAPSITARTATACRSSGALSMLHALSKKPVEEAEDEDDELLDTWLDNSDGLLLEDGDEDRLLDDVSGEGLGCKGALFLAGGRC
jgi:hypothetical protein